MWEQLPDYPPASLPSPSQQLHALQRLAGALDPAGDLPKRCADAEQVRRSFDATAGTSSLDP